MRSSISAGAKKRGRPKTTGKGQQIGVRLLPQALLKLDDWIGMQSEPKPSRPEAIRKLVDQALSSADAISLQSDASINRQIAEQKAVIAEIPVHSEPSPEGALAAMDKAVAQNDLVDMKNERTRRKITARKAGKPPRD